MPSESIASHPSRVGSAEPCAGCGAALASDQRYCLECGERRAPISSVLLGGTEPASSPQSGHASTPPTPPGPLLEPGQSSAGGAPRGNTVTVIAGVGVLLLAMGVGVLIGRSGGTQPAASAPQVISVASGPATGTSTSQSAPFTDDWPSGTDGYTIRLQALPQASTQADAVGAAKAEARAKGAKGVGALKSEDFSSLKAGSYIVYSGVYPKQAEAQKALAGLKKSFPHATVIKVSSSGPAAAGASPGAGSGSGAAGGGAGSSPPASSKVLEDLHKSKGKSYEEKSKNLPNQVET